METLLYMTIDLLCGLVVPLPFVLIFMSLSKNRNGKKTLWVVLFTIYLAKMFDVVGIPGFQYMTWEPILNLIPFQDEKNLNFVMQVGLYAAMFVPFGFMLPLIWKRYRSGVKTVLAGFLLSLSIEVIQLFSFRATDIDDLLMNTLGAAIGYGVIRLFAGKKWKNEAEDDVKGSRKDLLQYAVVVLIILLTFIFVKFSIASAVYGTHLFD